MTHPFTETYILMASKAQEIQAMRKQPEDFQPGDFYESLKEGVLVRGSYNHMRLWTFWIPRLDQILGMLGGPSAWHALHLDIEGDAWSDFPGIDDWHELALSVVMREKHGKIWKEGEWQLISKLH